MNFATKIARNYIIQIISKIISTALGLVAVALIARYLGQAGFGAYTTAMTFISFFAILADLGITLVTIQITSQNREKEAEILSNLWGLRIVSAIVFLGIGPLIVFLFPYNTTIKTGVLIAAFASFFTALSQILIGLCQKNLQSSYIAWSELLSRCVLIAGVLYATTMNYGLWGILVVVLVSNIFTFATLLKWTLGFSKFKISFNLLVWKNIFSSTWPIAVTTSLNLIYLKTDTLILSLIKSENEVGLYGAAYKVVDVLTTLPFIFGSIILAPMILRWRDKNKDGLSNILQKSYDTMLIIILPVVFGTQILGGKIMSTIAGEEFEDSGKILQILTIACLFIFIQVIFSHAIIAIEKQRAIIKFYAFTAITALAGYLILIPAYSYWGAAWVTVYSEFMIGAAAFYFIYQTIGFIPKQKILFKSTVASLIMLFLVAPLKNQSLFLSIGVGGIIYFCTLYVFRGLNFIPIREIVRNDKTLPPSPAKLD